MFLSTSLETRMERRGEAKKEKGFGLEIAGIVKWHVW
jgi:hypothetical protein